MTRRRSPEAARICCLRSVVVLGQNEGRTIEQTEGGQSALYDAKQIEEIAARVQQRIDEEESISLTGKVISVKKVRDAYESGHHVVRVPRGALITAEASDYLYDKRMTVLKTDGT